MSEAGKAGILIIFMYSSTLNRSPKLLFYLMHSTLEAIPYSED